MPSGPVAVAAADGFRGYTLGSDAAPIEIAEYSDFECPFCASFATVQMPVIRTLATMAHDCRRTELFQGELLAALKILQRGDLPLRDLIGAFAGEIGQTQFLPSSYIK